MGVGGDTGVVFAGGRYSNRIEETLPTPVFLGFPCGSAGKESACNVGDLGSIPGLGGSPGERKGYPLQYSGLENSMDCIVHGVAKSRTQLSNFHFSLMLGNTEGRRRSRWQRMGWLDAFIDSMDMSLRKLWEMVKNTEARHATVHGVAKSQTQLSDWTRMVVANLSQSIFSLSLFPWPMLFSKLHNSPFPHLRLEPVRIYILFFLIFYFNF